MKFNIGDRVQTKLNRTPGTVRRIRDGMVAVETDDPNYGVPLPGFGIQRGLFLSADAWEKISPSKIVITSDGKTTLARLYDGNRVIRRAEAKCSPEDTYDFATGADLAYDRLMRPTSVEPQDKPRFKAGDKVKVVANTCVHGAAIGSIVTLDKPYTPILHSNAPAWTIKGNNHTAYTYISERDMEPYTEPDKPVFSWEAFKAGKIAVHCDTEEKAEAFIAECNKRDLHWYHAKDGETNRNNYGSRTAYRYSFDSLGYSPCSYYESKGLTIIDYPFSPAKPAKPEAGKHLYSGKVVCVETHDDFTVGKVYTFTGGKVTDDSWTRRPMSSFVAESLEDWNSRCGDCIVRFVEYKGEAT